MPGCETLTEVAAARLRMANFQWGIDDREQSRARMSAKRRPGHLHRALHRTLVAALHRVAGHEVAGEYGNNERNQ